ncbi:ORF6N domain-containing protein [Mucilaginibacter ginkgonis]|uniref:ORF6N domain-containing protein n=1 Tax=Mucilaginibacter ginkgonis TaxID=2682091 RepID=A0A6I4HZ49_9SPHI|nr:ORF6N domain-containing protein [Mucilaginibacter ginkgonis]QQL50257.1 ORF6N domain-containing protein [Mucilaginibacter ginkgonis]
MEVASTSNEQIADRIFVIRGLKVMLDSDLADLYDVDTKVLKQAVRRNIARFLEDFMFELTRDEFEVLRSQFVTSKTDRRGGSRYLFFCFTEPGVAMLSSILNSEKAILINIQIIRIFISMRQAMLENGDMKYQIELIKKRIDNQDKNLEIVFQYLDNLLESKSTTMPRKRIGFKSDDL